MYLLYIQRLNLTVVTTCAQIILIFCALIYPILQPNSIVTQLVLIILAIFQGAVFFGIE
jgi:hypothetical protein